MDRSGDGKLDEVRIGPMTAGGGMLVRPRPSAGELPDGFRLPGERWSTDGLQLLQASPHRLDPRCPWFGECGGCSLQHADYRLQLSMKRAMLSRLLRTASRSPGLSVEVVPNMPWSYRTRISLSRDAMDQAFSWRARRSRRLVPVDCCPIAHPQLEAVLADPPSDPGLGKRIHVLLGDSGPAVAPDGEQAWPAKVTVAGTRLSADAAGFFQASVPGLEAALPVMRDYLGETETVLDLYGGIGLLPALLSPGARVTLVEARVASARMAEENLPGASVYALPVDEWLDLNAGLPAHFCTILVDPPRAGLSRKLRAALAASPGRRIFYLSCDAGSLARDIQELCSSGYRLARAALLDFFPQTSRIEALCLLEAVA